MKRENILTGSPWEDKMGYCRAVRIGNIIEVSGTVAIVDGEKVKADDAHAQTLNILERVEKVLEDEPGYFGWIQNADFPLYTKKVLTGIKLRKLNNKF